EIEELEKLVGANVESKALSELVTIKQIKDLKPFPTQVTYFTLNEKVKQMAKNIHTFKDSHILQMCWEKEAKALDKEDVSDEEAEASELASSVSLKDVHTTIWEPCLDKYKEIFKKIKEGSLTFEEVSIIFKDFVDRYEDLRSDFKIMSGLEMSTKSNWIEKRIQQIREYHQLHLAVESAQIIMKAQNILNLTGNFNVLQTLILLVSYLLFLPWDLDITVVVC
ncbi:hypothetical protein chiPu_0026315, partial [Chiloscyllium punctatum]|nr:hypothetical protein [Chiloscyllium punctatum]